MKYKVGDVVVLKNEGRPETWNKRGDMDIYLGKTVTIASILDDLRFRINDDSSWTFRFANISHKLYSNDYEIY